MSLTKKRLQKAATRREQRSRQRLLDPVKFELLKSKNRFSTAKYDQIKREKRQLMSEDELIADRKIKADARTSLRIKKKIALFGME